VRKRIGDDVKLMVDYNQALTVDDALERGRALDRKKSIGWRSRSGTTIMPAPRVLAVN
jgi:L-alanine-DL-glutamate epimerase-like enolase superfamily enzyme